jgi:glycosyltransferase involved in cell wall biosynthesis
MSSPKRLKIFFLVPYPYDIAPGQRFRYEQYLSLLESTGSQVKVFSFLSVRINSILYQEGKTLEKIWGVTVGFLKRFLILPLLVRGDFIFVFREVTPVGPPIIEWIIAKILRKKIIYDFDDSIWLTDRHNEPAWFKILKWRTKVKSICKWSYKISCGNEYLCDYAKMFNQHVLLNPTTINVEKLHNPDTMQKKRRDEVVIGWTGSHSTLKYLHEIESVLARLEDQNPKLKILIIADRPPLLSLKSMIFIPWNKKSEAQDLMQIDIGIMPLPNDEWAKGKCGFKALQYMALEIPVVCSKVGANIKIIDHNMCGFLCSTTEEWSFYLQNLIDDISLRAKFGKAGRKKVLENYSVTSNSSNFLSLFLP